MKSGQELTAAKPTPQWFDIRHHLKAERFCHWERYRSVSVDLEGCEASFIHWGLDGKFAGHTVYDPRTRPRYFSNLSWWTPWGLETVEKDRPLAVVEGIFDACVLHLLGFSAIAIMSHTPPRWFRRYISQVMRWRHPYILHIKDGDGNGRSLTDAVLQCPSGHDVNSLGLEETARWLKREGFKMPMAALPFMRGGP